MIFSENAWAGWIRLRVKVLVAPPALAAKLWFHGSLLLLTLTLCSSLNCEPQRFQSIWINEGHTMFSRPLNLSNVIVLSALVISQYFVYVANGCCLRRINSKNNMNFSAVTSMTGSLYVVSSWDI